MARRILVVGSANMDFSMNVYKIPDAGETVIDDGGVAYTPGGKGANAAITLKKLGAECALCAKLGADLHGQKLYSYYKDTGIETAYVKADHDHPTGLAVVIKDGTGENRIVVYPGANGYITTESVMEAFEYQPDAVYIGFEIPFPIALAAAKIAAAKGIPIFIDPAPANKEYDLESLPEVEIFSPNETECEQYTGILPTSMESSLRAALALYRRVKCKYLVIKQGSRGAFLYDGKKYTSIPALRADKTVDTTAAGDSFIGGLCTKLCEGASMPEAVGYATAVSTLTVSRAGASVSIPTYREVEAFIATLS